MLTLNDCKSKIDSMSVGDRLCFKKINSTNFKGFKVEITSTKIKDTDLESITETPQYVWKAAEYTDEWVFSDGQNHTLIFDETSWSLDGYVLFNNNENATIINNSIIVPEYMSDIITAYRKYTPGHWEDDDGNWVQGEWSEWDKPDNVTYLEWIDYEFDESGWLMSVGDSADRVSSNRNENLIYIERNSTLTFATRTWTTTVPAPTT